MPLRPACCTATAKVRRRQRRRPVVADRAPAGPKARPPARNNNSFHFFNVNSNLKFEVLLKWPSLSLSLSLSLSILRRMAQFSKRPPFHRES